MFCQWKPGLRPLECENCGYVYRGRAESPNRRCGSPGTSGAPAPAAEPPDLGRLLESRYIPHIHGPRGPIDERMRICLECGEWSKRCLSRRHDHVTMLLRGSCARFAALGGRS